MQTLCIYCCARLVWMKRSLANKTRRVKSIRGVHLMSPVKKLWWCLGILFVGSFGALLLIGGEIYRQAPPEPEVVVAEDGRVLFTLDDIQRGRQVWQTMGGQ